LLLTSLYGTSYLDYFFRLLNLELDLDYVLYIAAQYNPIDIHLAVILQFNQP
jgi:hypothetical protein